MSGEVALECVEAVAGLGAAGIAIVGTLLAVALLRTPRALTGAVQENAVTPSDPIVA